MQNQRNQNKSPKHHKLIAGKSSSIACGGQNAFVNWVIISCNWILWLFFWGKWNWNISFGDVRNFPFPPRCCPSSSVKRTSDNILWHLQGQDFFVSSRTSSTLIAFLLHICLWFSMFSSRISSRFNQLLDRDWEKCCQWQRSDAFSCFAVICRTTDTVQLLTNYLINCWKTNAYHIAKICYTAAAIVSLRLD